MRAASTPAHREAPHEALIRGGGWHKAEVTPRSREAPQGVKRCRMLQQRGCRRCPGEDKGRGGAQRLGEVGRGMAP